MRGVTWVVGHELRYLEPRLCQGLQDAMLAAPEGGYWGEVPAMPGCVSEGETKAGTLANVIEAAHGCLDAYLSTRPESRSPSGN